MLSVQRISDNPDSGSDTKASAAGTRPPSHEKARPRLLVKLSMALAGFVFGVVASPFAACAFVALTYSCQPGPGEPCDAGAYVGMGLAILLVPILSSTFAALGYWWAARHERRRVCRRC